MTETMSERINDLMIENNLTGEKLAKAVGVSFAAVSQWKTETNEISIDNILSLAKLFNCSIDYLTGRSETDLSFREIETTFILRLQGLLTKNSTSLYALNKNGVMPKSSYYTWLKGAAPRLSNIIPIANYFDCSLDFLIGCKE